VGVHIGSDGAGVGVVDGKRGGLSGEARSRRRYVAMSTTGRARRLRLESMSRKPMSLLYVHPSRCSDGYGEEDGGGLFGAGVGDVLRIYQP